MPQISDQPLQPLARGGEEVTLFLAGDVMTGRGVDQILLYPGDPQLYEPALRSAADYVALAEAANGPVRKPASFDYVWGDALIELEHRKPDARLVNLETALTASTQPAPKGINYKMSPKNVPVLTVAGIDCCTLANNHMLDWGPAGLLDTLRTLDAAGVKWAGAGRSSVEAAAPAVLPVGHKGRVVVFAFGSVTSGVPPAWAATRNGLGVNLLSELSEAAADGLASQVQAVKRPGDIVVASLHWGANWGYDVQAGEVAFAHRLIDAAGVDIVWGHSSHHPKAIAVHSGKLILYGCGDFIDDYEGIAGHEAFRADLVLMYFPTLSAADGALRRLVMVPLRMRNLRLNRASRDDAQWLRDVLDREGERHGTRVDLGPDNILTLRWRDTRRGS